MSVTFTFSLEDPSANQDPQHQIRVYESADGAAPWVLVDSAVIAELPVEAGTYTLLSDPADPASYHILSPVSATGAEYPVEVQKIIPPAAAEANVLTLFVNVADIDGDRRPGVVLSASPIPGETRSSACGIVVVGTERTTTNAEGFASLKIVSGVGRISVMLGDKNLILNTDGKGGMAVDLAGLLSSGA
jgi:hypothetical protein